jgi:hypothetical protein
MESLKKIFNTVVHGPVMWIAMAGMVLAALSVYPDPTILDVIIGVPIHLFQGAANLLGAGLPALKGVFASTLHGDILPNHVFDMWNASHAGTAAAGHLHGAGTAMANQWQWFGGLSEASRHTMMADASFFGLPLDQYLAGWCQQNGVIFTP